MNANPIVYVEIPVLDLDRAIQFFEAVFGFELERGEMDGYPMAFFPEGEGAGVSGALVQGDVYVPTTKGAIVYFGVADLDAVLARAEQSGGAVLYSKKQVTETSWVAEIQDSEGNRIALLQRKSVAS